MNIFDLLRLLCGLALFLYGMEAMGDALKRGAGSRLKGMLNRMTSTPFKGFLLGLGVTAVIQSSSATTVMVVGFVSSGIMLLSQAISVIMGANVGTAVTAWLTALSGLDGSAAVSSAVAWLKPSAWMPLLALLGLIFTMSKKRTRKKDIGYVLLGFSVLMVGMEMMADAVSGLSTNESFKSLLVMFENPFLGVLAGLVLTAVVQSSSASIGILQSLTTTGVITFGAAIPIIMGQNIGTCVTALISAAGANANGKRAAMAHLYFNVIGVILCLSSFYLINAVFGFAFVTQPIDMWGIAFVHTIFKILSVLLIAPFSQSLERLARLSIKNGKDEAADNFLLDKRLLTAPAVAVARANEVTRSMAADAYQALRLALSLPTQYDEKQADLVWALENKVDQYEDQLGAYLISISAQNVNEQESREITKLLYLLSDFERLSDHAVNIVRSAEEIKVNEITLSTQIQHELAILITAIYEVINLTEDSFENGSLSSAARIEPLTDVIHALREAIRRRHIKRLTENDGATSYSFILSDLLTDLERISAHCSNIAGCLLEFSQTEAQGMHAYLKSVRKGSAAFETAYHEYSKKYTLEEDCL